MRRYSTRDPTSPAIARKPTPPVKRHAEASTHPVDVLLIVDRDNPPRAAGLREEAVEAVERADVEHAAARKTIRAEHRKAVAVVAGDPRRVDPGRERERVKPQRNRIADALGVRNRAPIASTSATTRSAADVSGIGSIDSTAFAWPANASTPISRSHRRSHQHHRLAPAARDSLPARRRESATG